MKGKTKEEVGQDWHPWEGAVKKERFLHSGKPPPWWGDQPGQKGCFTCSEESASTGLWQAEQRPAQMVVPPRCMPQPETRIHWYGWGLGAETQVLEDWCWLCGGDSLKGLECITATTRAVCG